MAFGPRCVASAVILVIASSGLTRVCRAADAPLFEPSTAALKRVVAVRGKCETTTIDGAAWLHIRTADGGAVVAFAPAAGEWNLSVAAGLAFTLRNPNALPVTVRFLAETPETKGMMNACRNAIELRPGETRDCFFRLTRRPEDPTYKVFEPFYMYYKGINVRDNTIDPQHVSKLTIEVAGPDTTKGVDVSAIRTSGEGTAAAVPFFPFIDEYGQYTHGDWPGKIYSDKDFAARREAEGQEQAGWPHSGEWDRYGGWAKGPTLKATGFFHTAKHDGKWWLVDPDGKLFWSYGPTGVGFGGDITPVSERENWFVSLPDKDSSLGQFYKDGRGATYKYYEQRSWQGFDIQRANLFRKYGPDYEDKVAELSHDRLHSWGFNTMGNWSSAKIYGLHKTAYTVALGSPSVSMMRAADGHSIQDVYDPTWEPGMNRIMERERDKTAGDPWNLGYFIDNERAFGSRARAAQLAELALKASPAQPAKLKLIETLKAKYSSIAQLNKSWKTSYASWDALRDSKDAPSFKDNDALLADAGDFGMAFVERYFSVCRAAVKRVAPNNMYLGSRFYGHTDPAVVKLAAKYCDLISYNIYDNPPDGRVNQYASLDVPIMSTEWGIESDQTQTPLRDAKLTSQSPAERAAQMIGYVEHAIRLPNLVGAHFFQYQDQPLSGRPDGEATLRGFINVADTPNFELVQANRQFAYHLYQTRAALK